MMKKELKDYLPFFLGCEVEYEGILNGKELKAEKTANKDDFFYTPKVKEEIGLKRGFLKSVDVGKDGKLLRVQVGRKRYGLKSYWYEPAIKLILRPLSDWSLRESSEYGVDIAEMRSVIELGVYEPNLFHYLLSKHFDLFGLIEAGLAIDKTKNPTP